MTSNTSTEYHSKRSNQTNQYFQIHSSKSDARPSQNRGLPLEIRKNAMRRTESSPNDDQTNISSATEPSFPDPNSVSKFMQAYSLSQERRQQQGIKPLAQPLGAKSHIEIIN